MYVAQHDMKRLIDKNRFGSFAHSSLVEPVLLSISAPLHDSLAPARLYMYVRGVANL